ncbi:MAG: hypothetical protein ACUVQ0_04870 [Thermoproteota archaeon]
MAVLGTGSKASYSFRRMFSRKLYLNKLKTDRRSLILANGSTIESTRAFSEAFIFRIIVKLEGFLETMMGLEYSPEQAS